MAIRTSKDAPTVHEIIRDGEGDIWSRAYLPYANEPIRTVAASPIYISRVDPATARLLSRARKVGK
jgi:hypothetical protein